MQLVTPTIDLNCDAGSYAFRDYPQMSVAETAAELSRRGITCAYVGSAAAITYISPHPANQRLAVETAAADLSGVEVRLAAVLNPEYPGALDDLRDCAARGFQALKLYPTYHAFDLTGYATAQLVEAATELGWPVLLAMRVEDERHHHPLMKVPALPPDTAITFARNVDAATVVLCTATAGEIVGFLNGVRREGVAAEVSYVKGPLNAVEDLVSQVGYERLVFGSHLPFSYAQTALAKIKEAPLTAEAIAALLSGNALRLTGG